MQKLYFVILVGLIGCAQNDRVSISDLRFPDPQRLNSVLNQVDTAFIYTAQENGLETMFYQTFDQEGRVACDSTQPYTLVKFYYDSIGLMTKRVTTKDGYTWTDSISYNFDQDSLILEQQWTGISNEKYLFYFDETGRLSRSLKFESTNDSPEETRYAYDGNLLSSSTYEFGDKARIQIVNRFYYSATGFLDSSTLHTSYGHRQSWNYDSVGLLANEWNNTSKGNSRFTYKMRR